MIFSKEGIQKIIIIQIYFLFIFIDINIIFIFIRIYIFTFSLHSFMQEIVNACMKKFTKTKQPIWKLLAILADDIFNAYDILA